MSDESEFNFKLKPCLKENKTLNDLFEMNNKNNKQLFF